MARGDGGPVNFLPILRACVQLCKAAAAAFRRSGRAFAGRSPRVPSQVQPRSARRCRSAYGRQERARFGGRRLNQCPAAPQTVHCFWSAVVRLGGRSAAAAAAAATTCAFARPEPDALLRARSVQRRLATIVRYCCAVKRRFESTGIGKLENFCRHLGDARPRTKYNSRKTQLAISES